MTTRSPKISVALSGGGHRAALFSLGALMYLVDAGCHRNTVSIASASGGSITNAYIAQVMDFTRTSSGDFEHRVVRPLARQIAHRGTLFAPWFPRLYMAALVALATLVVLGLAAVLVGAEIAIAGGVSGAAFAVLLVLWCWRDAVATAAYRVSLFSRGGFSRRVADICGAADHVLCATDLRSKQQVYFGGRFVYNRAWGVGAPGNLSLERVVRASTSLPGFFPLVVFRPAEVGFVDPTSGPEADDSEGPRRRPGRLVLTDGGVYDNLAVQWTDGLRRIPEPHARLRELTNPDDADALFVIDSGGDDAWRWTSMLQLPIVGDVLALLRSSTALQDAGIEHQRSHLVSTLDPFRPSSGGDAEGTLQAVLIRLTQTPYDVAEAYLARPRTEEPEAEPEAARCARARAQRVIDKLGQAQKPRWQALVRGNAAVPTSLYRMGPPRAARLLRHGYVVAMCNLHAIFGRNRAPEAVCPLLDVPALSRFEELLQ